MSFLTDFKKAAINATNAAISELKTNQDWARHYPDYQNLHSKVANQVGRLIGESQTRGEVVYWCTVLFTKRDDSIGLSQVFADVRRGKAFEDAISIQRSSKNWKSEIKNPIAFLKREFGLRSAWFPDKLQWGEESLKSEFENACSLRSPSKKPTLVPTSEVMGGSKPTPAVPCIEEAKPAPSGISYARVVESSSSAAPEVHRESPNSKRVKDIVERARLIEGVSTERLLDVIDDRLEKRDLGVLADHFIMVENCLKYVPSGMTQVLQSALDALANVIKAAPVARTLDEVLIILDGEQISAKKALEQAKSRLRTARINRSKALLEELAAKTSAEQVVTAVTASGVLGEAAGLEAQELIAQLTE